MNTNGLSKLELSDLTYVSGGQIYEFFDGKKEAYCYLVPSAAGYATYHNKTEAKLNSRHLPRNNIVNCTTLDNAIHLAQSDCAFYRIIASFN